MSKADVKIDRRVFDQLLARAHGLDQLEVRVGVMGQKGGDEKVDGSDFDMVDLFATHEFGTKDGHIPERAPLRTTFEENKPETAKMCADLAAKVVTEGMAPERALNLLGTWGANQVKNRITQGEHLPPPLAESTKAAKGSDRPLVDTGRMVQAITHVVTREGDD